MNKKYISIRLSVESNQLLKSIAYQKLEDESVRFHGFITKTLSDILDFGYHAIQKGELAIDAIPMNTERKMTTVHLSSDDAKKLTFIKERTNLSQSAIYDALIKAFAKR